MKLGLLKETYANEARVALTPDVISKLTSFGFEISFEAGAGTLAGYPDAAYAAAGATINDKAQILKNSSILVTVSPLMAEDVAKLDKGTVLVGVLKPFAYPNNFALYNKYQLTTFAMERIPRITRAQSMDVVSSQSSLSGYRAVIEAAERLGRALPLMMTAAGTIRPAKMLVLGAGVAGLQAIATGKRLGAVVSAFDVRTAAKEQVESLGASFVEVPVTEEDTVSAAGVGGYATEMSAAYKAKQMALLADVIQSQDIVITTALIPGKPAPVLITTDMVKTMKTGAVIVDLASENGGNCVLSKHGKTDVQHGVILHAPANILSNIAHDASQTYARNVLSFLTGVFVIQDNKITWDAADEIVTGTLLTTGSKTVNPAFDVVVSDSQNVDAPKASTKKVKSAESATQKKPSEAKPSEAKPTEAK